MEVHIYMRKYEFELILKKFYEEYLLGGGGDEWTF